MAAPKTQEEQAPQQSLYPVIEALVESASPEEVGAFFDSLKEGLGALKGPKAEQAKKVKAAIARTEELLSHLLQVREKLEEERNSGGKPR